MYYQNKKLTRCSDIKVINNLSNNADSSFFVALTVFPEFVFVFPGHFLSGGDGGSRASAVVLL